MAGVDWWCQIYQGSFFLTLKIRRINIFL